MTALSISREIQLKRNWKDFFRSKYTVLSFGKRLNNKIPGFQGGDIFLNWDNTELKRSSKINVSVYEGIAGW